MLSLSGKTKYPPKSHLKEGGEKPPWRLWEEGVWGFQGRAGNFREGLRTWTKTCLRAEEVKSLPAEL